MMGLVLAGGKRAADVQEGLDRKHERQIKNTVEG